MNERYRCLDERINLEAHFWLECGNGNLNREQSDVWSNTGYQCT